MDDQPYPDPKARLTHPLGNNTAEPGLASYPFPESGASMSVQDPAYPPRRDDLDYIEPGPALSWGAIIGGAVGAAAVSFVLLAVGTAFGLSMISPWETDRGDAAALGIGAAIFLIVIHVIASGFGGYLAGRLREKLTNLRHDETYFRDTAHGVLVWALGAVAGAVLIACMSAQVIGGGLTLGAAGVSAAGQAAGGDMAGGDHGAIGMMSQGRRDRETSAYFVDSLFRPNAAAATGAATTPTPDLGAAAPTANLGPSSDSETKRGEVGRILGLSLAKGEVSPEDRTYVAQLVAQQTGMNQADAERRVDEVVGKAKAARDEAVTKAREAAEQARKATQFAAIWSAIAMLAGGVAAGLAATWGGRARDQ